MNLKLIIRLMSSISVASLCIFYGHSARADSPCEIKGDVVSVLLIQKNYSVVEGLMQACLGAYKKGQATAEDLGKAFWVAPNALDGYPDNILDGWIEKYPNSYAARVSRAIFYERLGWKARGGRFASETSKEQFDALKKYMLMAKQDIGDSIPLDNDPMLSYWQAIGIAKGLGTDVGTVKNLRDQATKLDPKAYEVRRYYLDYVSPKWFGSIPLMNEALEEANSSEMSEDNKKHFQAGYLSTLADYLWVEDRTPEAIELYIKAYKIYPNVDFLEGGLSLAKKANLHDKAIEILTQIIANDPKKAHSFNRRGYEYLTFKKDPQLALKDYQAAAALGDAWASAQLGWWYMNGYNVNRDLSTAEYYLKIAAEKGDESAIKSLKHLQELKDKQGDQLIQAH